MATPKAVAKIHSGPTLRYLRSTNHWAAPITALWLVSYAAILLQMPEPDPLILGFSILYLFYYFGLSLYLSNKMPGTQRAEQPEA
jgi:hypothetical protein